MILQINIIVFFIYFVVANISHVEGMLVTASTNASTVHVGEIFTLQCKTPNFKLENNGFVMTFYSNISGGSLGLAQYEIKGLFKFFVK